TKVESWSVERSCYMIELYNGFGYRRHGIYSPYLWSFSSNYSAGKYVQDGQWSASAVDAQCGVMPLISRLMAADPSVAFDPSPISAVAASPALATQPPSSVSPVSTPLDATRWLQNALN